MAHRGDWHINWQLPTDGSQLTPRTQRSAAAAQGPRRTSSASRRRTAAMPAPSSTVPPFLGAGKNHQRSEGANRKPEALDEHAAHEVLQMHSWISRSCMDSRGACAGQVKSSACGTEDCDCPCGLDLWDAFTARMTGAAPGLALSHQTKINLAPGNASLVTASQPPVITGDPIVFPMHKKGLNYMEEPRQRRSRRLPHRRRGRRVLPVRRPAASV